MCRLCQSWFESCYWHLIEKPFCYDETIALYEMQDEKNNNGYDNMAFYDSVAVIAGRSIVTIDPIIMNDQFLTTNQMAMPIVKQPIKRLQFDESDGMDDGGDMMMMMMIKDGCDGNLKTRLEPPPAPSPPAPSPAVPVPSSSSLLEEPRPNKSLRERRMSKSLYLKIDKPKELPLVRQQSMPKFYLDTPDDLSINSNLNPITTPALYRIPSSTLTSPVPPNHTQGFVFDLYSVVQLERARIKCLDQNYCNKEDKSSRLCQIKEKIKLMRSRSYLSINSATNTNSSNTVHHM